MVGPCVMLTLVINQIFLSRVPAEFVHILDTLVTYPEKCISIEQERCRLTVLFAMPTAEELLQCTGILGCECPISLRIS
jgi:hypothetical protein